MNCQLCNKKISHPQEVLLENELCFFLDSSKYVKEGVLIGSGLIVTKEHFTSVFEMEEEHILSIFSLLEQVKTYLDNKYHPDGYNLGWNVGEVGGQNLEHAHMHVLPRFKQETMAKKGIRYMLKNQPPIKL